MEYIKCKLTLPISETIPDRNGRVFSKEAIEQMCKSLEGMPIISRGDTSINVVGATKSGEYIDDNITVDGILWGGYELMKNYSTPESISISAISLGRNDCDVIRGRRLTDIESSYLMCPDLPFVDEKIFEEVIEPFAQNYSNKVGRALKRLYKRFRNKN